MRAPFNIRINQVIDGKQYKGFIVIGDVQFKYEVVFIVPIPQLVNLKVQSHKELIEVAQIFMSRDKTILELSADVYTFFFTITANFAVILHDLPQTRHVNNMPPQLAVCNSLSGNFGVGMQCDGEVNISEELCLALSKSRFGCSFREFSPLDSKDQRV